MDVVSVRISHGDEQLHQSSHTVEQGTLPDLTTVEGKRAFMDHTIEGLMKLKENSDATLTAIIEGR